VSPRIPAPVQAVLACLRLDCRDAVLPAGDGWNQALEFALRTQLTLPWRARLAHSEMWGNVPEPVRRRLDQNWADNTKRLGRIQDQRAQITSRFTAAGVQFVELKGLTHSPHFVTDPRERVQYDFDFYCPAQDILRARDELLQMGYRPFHEASGSPMDHLPAMIREAGWRWRENYFDPDQPPSVDLHFRFWDAETERLAAPGVGRFWDRRAGSALDPADQLGYAALHALRHVLRGDLRLFHIYEIACFLEKRRDQPAFWSRWRDLHDRELRRLESLVFRLAEIYFGSTNPAPLDHPWFERYAWSPVESLFRGNKHELLLHLSLVPGRGDRWRILRRRLLPARVPAAAEAVHEPENRIRMWAGYCRFVARRFAYHVRVLLPTLRLLARQRWSRP